MATSGSVTTNAYDGRSLTFSWSRASYSVENNTTTITWSLKGSGSQTQWFMSGPFLVRINDVQQYYSSSRIQLKNGTTVASGSYTVQHDSVGWGAFTVYIEAAVYSYSVNVSASQQFVMESIPRATTPSVSGTLKMGNTVTINLPRASSSFTHIVTYSFGSIWDTISSNAGASVQWTIPRNLATQIPNGTTGTLYISAQTISNGQNIGTKQISVTLQVSDSDVPSISSVSVAEAVSGLASKFGFYVQGKSRLSVGISASGIYGSTIQSYSASLNGVNYSGSSFTTDYIYASGTLSITVRDSRGRTATTTRSISVTAYNAPSIATLTAARVNSSGVSDEENGTYLRVAYSFSITSLSNKNDKTYTLQYKASTASSWTTLASGSVYSANTVYLSTSGILDVDQSYDVRLIITDYFNSGVTAVASVSVAFVLVDYHQSGRGMAIGKVAEITNRFDVALQSTFRNAVTVDGNTTLNGLTSLQGGTWLHNASGTGGTAGYVCVARITHNRTWSNSTLKFTIAQRGLTALADLYVQFGGQDNTDPPLNSFQFVGSGNFRAYIVKVATSTWDLYIGKQESWDSIAIVGFQGDFGYNSPSQTKVEWRDIQASSVPSGYTQATNFMTNNAVEFIINPVMSDYVVEQGTSGIWRYRKMNSGVSECWGTWTGTLNLGENNYSGFQYTAAQQISLPSGLFTGDGPRFWVDMGPSQFIALCRAFSRTNTWVRFVACGHMNVSQSSCTVFLYCQGNWK